MILFVHLIGWHVARARTLDHSSASQDLLIDGATTLDLYGKEGGHQAIDALGFLQVPRLQGIP